LLDIIVKNPQQKSADFAINVRTLSTPQTYYTCPNGKVARVQGRVTCTGLGAALQARFSIAGIIFFRWSGNVGTGVSFSIPDATSVVISGNSSRLEPVINTYRVFDQTLNAGETVESSQSSGTNSEFNLFMTVTEKPI